MKPIPPLAVEMLYKIALKAFFPLPISTTSHCPSFSLVPYRANNN